MELKNINRKYNSFKFTFTSIFDEKKYQKLVDNMEYESLKNMFIPYYEEKLQIVASYLFIFKNIIPIILMLLYVLLKNFNSFYFICSLLLINIIVILYLHKKYKITYQIYSFEITAIDDFLNEKYNTKINTNLNKSDF